MRRATAVLAIDDLRLWLELQSATLDRVHHSWFAGADAALVARARRNPFGRRWLAMQLIRRRPILFSPTEWQKSNGTERLRGAAWLTRPLAEPTECALELGAMALAGLLRTIVARVDVMKLRVALGAVRYERVLASQVAAADRVATLDGLGVDIVDHVLRRGATELAQYAAAAHPAWGESVRLSFERLWWDGTQQGSLTPALVEAALRRPEDPIEVVLTGSGV
jgi:hypothetical protein